MRMIVKKIATRKKKATLVIVLWLSIAERWGSRKALRMAICCEWPSRILAMVMMIMVVMVTVEVSVVRVTITMVCDSGGNVGSSGVNSDESGYDVDRDSDDDSDHYGDGLRR